MKPTFNNEIDYQIFPSTLDSLYQTTCRMKHGGRIFCTAGEATVIINDKSYHLTKNASIALLPYSFMQVSARSEDLQTIVFACTIAFSRIAGKGLHSALRYYIEHPLIERGEDAIPYIHQALKGLQQLPSEHSHRIEIALNQIRCFLLHLSHSAEQQHDTDNNPNKTNLNTIDYFYRFAWLLGEQCTQERQVNYYANQLAITPEYLNSICKKFTGCSAKSIIDQYLITLLKHELFHSSKNLQEIAETYHFIDAADLSRFFKRTSGQAPNELRP